MLRCVVMIAVFLVALGRAHAESLRLGEIAIEGRIHKPEVVFISDRIRVVPTSDGVQRLREDPIRQTLKEGRSLAAKEPGKRVRRDAIVVD